MVVVTDDILVDPEFGTGCVKITPSHDFNDYECGKRNNLEFINILNEDGTMNENCGKYAGLHRFKVRELIQKDLKELGLLKEKLPNKMVLSLCSRSKDVIEPMMKPQWYVNC